jgi:hypothetical protein
MARTARFSKRNLTHCDDFGKKPGNIIFDSSLFAAVSRICRLLNGKQLNTR